VKTRGIDDAAILLDTIRHPCGVDNQRMLKKFLAAEVLEVRVLHPAIAQSLVGKVVSVFKDRWPAISRVGNGGWPGLSVYTAPNLSSRKRQSIACPSFTNACVHVEDLVKP